jgi:hypothetical protein
MSLKKTSCVTGVKPSGINTFYYKFLNLTLQGVVVVYHN